MVESSLPVGILINSGESSLIGSDRNGKQKVDDGIIGQFLDCELNSFDLNITKNKQVSKT